MVKLGPPIAVFYVCRDHVLGIINLLSSLVRMWVFCHHCFIASGAGLMLLSRGFFFAKQACLVLWLSKLALLSNHYLTGVSHIFFYLRSPSGINYFISHFALSLLRQTDPFIWSPCSHWPF